MLDNSVTLLSVNNSIDATNGQSENTLVLTSCEAKMNFEDELYNEFDELNCNYLNANDYGCGALEFYLSFSNIFQNPYQKFYISCFSIRTNTYLPIKINGKPEKYIKRFHEDHYTKIDKNGNLGIGIGYFFRSEKERESIINCNKICLEGFIAFGKKKNVYGINCKFEKDENDWCLKSADTYMIDKHRSIFSYIH